MKFLPFEIKNGSTNMKIDKELLENAIAKNEQEHIFRLYGWAPKCISLGRNQKSDFLDLKFLKENNIDLVKRLTGGRALFHDKELTYSYICPVSGLKHGDSIIESYKEISQIFIDKFKTLGIELEFGDKKQSNFNINYCMQVATGADLCYNGKKLIGSAQLRKNNYILQHGSILFDYNLNLLEKLFKEQIDRNHITCIKEINENLSFTDILNLWN